MVLWSEQCRSKSNQVIFQWFYFIEIEGVGFFFFFGFRWEMGEEGYNVLDMKVRNK